MAKETNVLIFLVTATVLRLDVCLCQVPLQQTGASNSALAGGLGGVTNNNDAVDFNQETSLLFTAMQTQIRSQFADQAGFTPTVFDLVGYRSQVVAGTNYFAKVRVTPNDEYAHLRIFRPLPYLWPNQNNPVYQLKSFQRGKTLNDPIEYFDGNQQQSGQIVGQGATRPCIAVPTVAASSSDGSNSNLLVPMVGAPVQQSVQNNPDADQLKSALAGTIRQQFIGMTRYTPPYFDLISYTKQVVSGTNYIAKIATAPDEYAHLRIYKPLFTSNMQLVAVQRGKMLSDPLQYFEANSGDGTAVQVPVVTALGGKNMNEGGTTQRNFIVPTVGTPLVGRGTVGGSVMVPMVGGTVQQTMQGNSEADQLNDAIQSSIRQQFITKTGGYNPSRFDLVSYSKQVVSGTNYFAKVATENDYYVHLRIYKPLFTSNMQLVAIQLGHTLQDPLQYFEAGSPGTIS